MPRVDASHRQLCKRLGIETHFFQACLEASIIEMVETQGHWDLGNGTALRLRRLQRVCTTFNVDVPVALILCEFKKLEPPAFE